ncbi:hypothetical protein [Methylobacterium sp. E-045]|uniref:hypothetical protein n=1 Tax=Methylobacterium sp. E-045 TaxID=2836575 RepID=UPI001FB8A284|nr:hypothetical protein [Methylobacterium sp. E-045]MCJ2128567.1 hypothetical protein [Methylobacterium sp. E-045]
MSKSARNDRIRYRATFLTSLGTSLVMVVGIFLSEMRLYEGYDHRLPRSETWRVSLRLLRTEPGAVSVTTPNLGFMPAFHRLAPPEEPSGLVDLPDERKRAPGIVAGSPP